MNNAINKIPFMVVIKSKEANRKYKDSGSGSKIYEFKWLKR